MLLVALAVPTAMFAFAEEGRNLKIGITGNGVTDEITVFVGSTVDFEVIASTSAYGNTAAVLTLDGTAQDITFNNNVKSVARDFSILYDEIGEYIVAVSVTVGKEGTGNYDAADSIIIVNVIEIPEVPDVLVSAEPFAAVTKEKGNKNTLTVTVLETYESGKTENLVGVFTIDNNAIGIYNVGRYNVYVDTKGNVQIRACYIVE